MRNRHYVVLCLHFWLQNLGQSKKTILWVHKIWRMPVEIFIGLLGKYRMTAFESTKNCKYCTVWHWDMHLFTERGTRQVDIRHWQLSAHRSKCLFLTFVLHFVQTCCLHSWHLTPQVKKPKRVFMHRKQSWKRNPINFHRNVIHETYTILRYQGNIMRIT